MLAVVLGLVTAVAEKVELPLFGKLGPDNAHDYFNVFKGGEKILWFWFDSKTVHEDAELHRDMLEEVARRTPGYKFVWHDTSEVEQRAFEEFGCKQFPCLSLLDPGSEEKMQKPELYTRTLEDIRPMDIASFLQDVKDNKIEPIVRDFHEIQDVKEDIPEM